MKTKQKVIIISIIAIMALALIGATIALVLVATRVTVSNSMTVSYKAVNVNAKIEASAKVVNPSGTSTTVLIDDGADGVASGSVQFHPADESVEGGFTFEDVELGAGEYVEYRFKISNLDTPNLVAGDYDGSLASNYAHTHTDEAPALGVLVNTIGETADDNIKVSIGKEFNDVDGYLYNSDTDTFEGVCGHYQYCLSERSSEYVSIRPADESATIILRLEPDDLSMDADLSVGFNIQLGKDIYSNTFEESKTKSLTTSIVGQNIYILNTSAKLTLDVYGGYNSPTTLLDSKYIDMYAKETYPNWPGSTVIAQTLDILQDDIYSSESDYYNTTYYVYTLTSNKCLDMASMTLSSITSGYTYKIGTSTNSADLTTYSSSNKTVTYGELRENYSSEFTDYYSLDDSEFIENSVTFVIAVSGSTPNAVTGLSVSFDLWGFYSA